MNLSLLIAIFFFAVTAQAGSHDASMQAALKGTWKSTCMDVGAGVYIVMTAQYDGAGKSEDKTLFYSDPGCTKPTEMIKTNKAKYVLGDPLDLGGGETAYAIDVTIEKWELSQYGSVLKRGGAVPTMYDIISVQGDKLYTGGFIRPEKEPLTDPAKRPSRLDKKNYFTRQK